MLAKLPAVGVSSRDTQTRDRANVTHGRPTNHVFAIDCDHTVSACMAAGFTDCDHYRIKTFFCPWVLERDGQTPVTVGCVPVGCPSSGGGCRPPAGVDAHHDMPQDCTLLGGTVKGPERSGTPSPPCSAMAGVSVRVAATTPANDGTTPGRAEL
ncbi:hypothetical protein E2C01_039485 [Portunus trituberculatus]|uniref:Uncharacterized protein n=1 Tax=Portunus trituberculatus TaxID=210409 RepID=A0A5B7FDS0_PORTR|nr:hypothetical protein [Portunus trituberculatus]